MSKAKAAVAERAAELLTRMNRNTREYQRKQAVLEELYVKVKGGQRAPTFRCPLSNAAD